MKQIQQFLQEVSQDPDTQIAAVKTTAGGGLSAITLNGWVAIVTIIYFLLQIGLLIPRYKFLWSKCTNSDKDQKTD